MIFALYINKRLCKLYTFGIQWKTLGIENCEDVNNSLVKGEIKRKKWNMQCK